MLNEQRRLRQLKTQTILDTPLAEHSITGVTSHQQDVNLI